MGLETRLGSLCSVPRTCKRSSVFADAFKKATEIWDRVLTFFFFPLSIEASTQIRLCSNVESLSLVHSLIHTQA